MVLQIVMHMHKVQLVSVTNRAIQRSVTVPTRRAGLKGGEIVILVLFPDLKHFSLYNCMNKARNKFSIFKDFT